MKTLIITEINSSSALINNMATLENIVILDSVCEAPWLFGNLSGVTIFVEAEEKDLRWDANYPGWNNGNKVLYGGDWIWVNFYDTDGKLLLSEPKRTNEVIRRPIAYREDEQYTYELIGWDLDGDGEPDTVPATSATDINAVAVYGRGEKSYTITFQDAETGEIYSQQSLSYGAVITPPATPNPDGRIFEGWNGYADGMTVTDDMTFTARWHSHSYDGTVIDPTCTEAGSTTYTCRCGDSYTADETKALGHAFENGTCIRCDAEDLDHVPENPFTDVPEDIWYTEPVLWAMGKGITAGVSATTFGPNAPCTRAQVVTFLWRAMGQPEPEKSDNPFTDVPEGVYYYKAVLWAVEKGVTSGMTATTFGPNAACTRAQVVTFLWRAVEQPKPEKTENPFTDVAEGWFLNPVLWAVERNITSGMSATTFVPNNPCTRAQVVTFLYRAMAEKG